MKVSTSRFGEFTLEKKDLITFVEGPLGLEDEKEFCLIDPGDETLILWLQSVSSSDIAFPILEPSLINPHYSITLHPNEQEALKLTDNSGSSVYVILTIPDDIKNITANMKAPIILNNELKLAKQIVLQDPKLEIKQSIYQLLKQMMSQRPSQDYLEIPSLSAERQTSDMNTQQNDKTISPSSSIKKLEL